MNQPIEEHRKTLIHVARSSITYGVRHGQAQEIAPEDFALSLRRKAATFVTLHHQGALRGCIGRLEAIRPLVVDVAMNAYAAAFQDPRFSPLSKEELPLITISISILSEPEPIHVNSEAELLKTLRPGIDGLIIEKGSQRGTFLPSVWEELPTPEEFLHHLKKKAGIHAGDSTTNIRYSRYTTTHIQE